MRSTPLRTKGLLEAASCAVVLALGISFAQTTSTQSQVVTLPVDRGPEGVAFDGVNIWIANSVGNTVTKLRASDEAYLGNFPVGNRPVAVAVSTSPPGSVSIWVANNRSNTLTKLRAFDGALLGTYPVGDGPSGLVYDCVNASIWVTNDRSNTVTRLRASDGANLGTFPVGKRPVGIAFDGTSIWVSESHSRWRLLGATSGWQIMSVRM